MSLQHSINRSRAVAATRRLAQLLLCAAMVAACATGPKVSQDAQLGPDGAPLQVREVPPEAQTLYERAVAVMAAGDYLEAQIRLQEFLLRYPDYPGAHVNLAIIFAANGDDTAAEGSITDALIIDPEHAPALNQLGMLLRRQGKFPEAEAAYLKAVTASPEYALAHYNLGVLHELYMRKNDAALEDFKRYQELGEEDQQVAKWITDLKRRTGGNRKTANVTE